MRLATPIDRTALVIVSFLAGTVVGTPPSSAEERADTPPPLTGRRQAEWRSRIRSELSVPSPLPTLSAESHGRFSPEPGVVAERVSYGTQFGMRVPAILYRPEKLDQRAPALIVVNGHGGDKFSWYAGYAGVLYARAGAIVLTYDPVGEGERNGKRQSGTRAHDTRLTPTEMGRRMGGLMMTDLMQAVSYLSERPEVDPRRIGAMGYSMGSFVVALAGAAETRLNACVLAGGGTLDGPGGYWDRSKPMCQGIPYQSMTFLGDRPAALFALHASRGPTLVYNGRDDKVINVPADGDAFFRDLQDRVASLKGDREGIFDFGFLPDASHRPYFVTRAVALWLERRLDFPNWTDAEVEGKLPETHISEWARDRNVFIERAYAIEEHEGGTHALGADVPGLAREDLFVLSPQEWERRKGELVYESWVEKARAAMEGGR